MRLKVTEIDGELGLILPDDLASRLALEPGAELFLIDLAPEGAVTLSSDPQYRGRAGELGRNLVAEYAATNLPARK